MKVIDRRMHNKVYVVDGSVEVIGGRNIGSESTSVGGQSYFTCGGNWYRPVMQNANIAYSVVANPG